MASLVILKAELKENKSRIRKLGSAPYTRAVTEYLDPDFFEGTIDNLISQLQRLSDNGFGKLTYEYDYVYDSYGPSDRYLKFIYTSTAPLEGDELTAAIIDREKTIERLKKRNQSLEKQIARLEMTQKEKELAKFAAWAKAHPEEAKKMIE